MSILSVAWRPVSPWLHSWDYAFRKWDWPIAAANCAILANGTAMKTTFDKVREIALGFPGVVEGTMYGSPAFKLGGQLLTCLASHKSAEPGTLVVRLDFEQRDALIAEDPDVYYLRDHYVGYPCVLVRLSRIHPDALRDLLGGARRFVIAQKARRKTAAGQRRRSRSK